ncbi:hypothetical protein [Methylomonas sp. YC3]
MKYIPEIHSFLNSKNSDRRTLEYIESMNNSIGIVSSQSGENEKNNQIISRKLQLCENSNSDRNQYLQHACELSVAAYFCRLDGVAFSYEYPGIKNKKDVDVSIVHNGTRYNIEVKCPNPKQGNGFVSTEKSLSLRTHGRFSQIEKINKDFEKLAKITGFSNFSLIKNSDQNIKEALLDSARKFKALDSKDDINCVVICGDDGDSLQHYWHTLYGSQGLFTEESFYPNTKDYSNVDAVVLTNIRHRHDNFFTNNYISDPWKFELAFNIVLENILSFDSRPKQLNDLANLIVHYTKELNAHEVPGDVEGYIKEDIKVEYFINHEMNKIDPSCFGSLKSCVDPIC